ncbi:acyl-CoA dehydrogenase family protein [Endozoicomonas sp. SM1973]|uniref:Acyl-CoA dehydrogenase family protein n=1 Tax=Spartinivicinus marinus TaxID=2994442 RepID=A0A853I4N9_9GAMM|nr:acyl-CoA dehydrogenase family protein [Spartinivicinus marinus]MCX4029347.1 acyl-CoA dehydrogenase family protein [Spartinivicinus marinus]NYZ64921.1 acyl-CoA dehydrogenase family protein [Spartinivicinus marinus]
MSQMTDQACPSQWAETHQVFNQPTPLENYNAFSSDLTLQHWMQVFAGGWGHSRCLAYGKAVGHELLQAGFLANKYKPEFNSHDRFGHRIDQVDYHPAYHQLMETAIESGYHQLPWQQPSEGANVVRAALGYLHAQADPGTGCPLTMTFAAVPTIRQQPELANVWLPKIFSRQYEPDNKPFFQKAGVTIGMAMTEKQGGSDVRANTTIATPIKKQNSGLAYELVGHKWFCSAPMCDAFVVLAQAKGGLSCFLMPRWRPDGCKNQIFIQRLKNKMGNVSNASSEVEFRGALAWLVGEEGQGVPTIIEMVALTRFDCIIGSAALMRQAVAQVLHHTAGRQAFGRSLQQQPLMQNVLADLAIESEAAIALGMRVAFSLDQQGQEHHQSFVRLATAVGKYWVCKRVVQHSYESMETIGGVAVVEDNILPRLYREAPINAIWEGSGNIQCLDVLRAIHKQSTTLEVFFQEIMVSKGSDKYLDNVIQQLKQMAVKLPQISVDDAQWQARQFVEKLALALQASILINEGESIIADAFIAGRLAEPHYQYGTLPASINAVAIIERAMPQLGDK